MGNTFFVNSMLNIAKKIVLVQVFLLKVRYAGVLCRCVMQVCYAGVLCRCVMQTENSNLIFIIIVWKDYNRSK